MKLIVGLGNPGKEYENTRHNVGFYIINNFAKSKLVDFKPSKFGGSIGTYRNCYLAKPLEYMNRSGIFVKNIIDFYEINFKDIIIIHDDMDYSIGKFALKTNISHGGHNGIKNIIELTKTNSLARMRVGIGRPNNDVADFVLSYFTKNEQEVIDLNLKKINWKLDLFIEKNVEVAQNFLNSSNDLSMK